MIFALGIRQVGAKAGKTLAAAFGSMDALMEAGLEELTEVPDVGEITALSLLDWFAQLKRGRSQFSVHPAETG